MTTQYTPILKLALPVTGELSGTWGDVVNNNITSMVEQAVAGLSTINTWTTNSHTLTTASGTTSESRCAMLVADDDGAGNPSAAATIICPAASKLYVLKNISGQTVTLKTSGGTGVAVSNNDTAFLFCDGTNVEACVTSIVNGHISGNLTVDGNTTLGDASGDTVTINAGTTTIVQGTANRVLYLNASKVISGTAGFTFDGTDFAVPGKISGALNGTVGATTPSTGAFTTLSATGTSTLGLGGTSAQQDIALINGSSASGYGPQARFYRNNVYKGAIGSQSGIVGDNSDNLYINAPSGASCVVGVNGTAVSTTSSTGLSVTGALSSTGAISKINTAATPSTCFSASGSTTATTYGVMSNTGGRLDWGVESSTGGQIIPGSTAYASAIASQTSAPLQVGVNGAVVGAFSSTGLSVTGSLSASTSLQIGSTSATITSAARFSTNSGGLPELLVLENAANRNADRGSQISFYNPNGSGTSQLGAAIFSANETSAASGPEYLGFKTGTGGTLTEKMRIDASGNLGLGVTPSAWGTSWRGFDMGGLGLMSAPAGSTANVSSNAYYNGTNWVYKATAAASYAGQATGVFSWWVAPGGTAGNPITFTQAMTLDASGNLGIGVTPAAWSSGRKALQISTFGAFAGTTLGTEVYSNAYVNTSFNYTYLNTAAATAYLQTVGTHQWKTAASGTAGTTITWTDAMTLDASGNFGIGTNSPATYGTLAVDTSKGATGVTFGDFTTVSNDTQLYMRSSGLAKFLVPVAGTFTFGSSGGAERMRIDTSGNLGLGVTPSAWLAGSKAIQLDSYTTVFESSAGASVISFNAYETGSVGAYKYLQPEAASLYVQVSGSSIWYNAPSGTAGAAITLTERMRLDASGNLGLGVIPSAYAGGRSLNVGNAGTGAFAAVSLGGSGGDYGGVGYNLGWQTTTGQYKYLQTDVSSWIQFSGGGFKFFTAPSGTAGTAIIFTQSLAVGFGTTLALEGATSATGTGIAFPATQYASSDANTLDDYEEGTWTPVITGTTTNGTGTYVNQIGTYVKVGKQVTITANVQWSAHTGTGNMQVVGIPFTNSSGAEVGGAVYDFVTLTVAAGSLPSVYISNSGTAIGVLALPTGGGTSGFVAMDTAAALYFTITYNV